MRLSVQVSFLSSFCSAPHVCTDVRADVPLFALRQNTSRSDQTGSISLNADELAGRPSPARRPLSERLVSSKRPCLRHTDFLSTVTKVLSKALGRAWSPPSCRPVLRHLLARPPRWLPFLFWLWLCFGEVLLLSPPVFEGFLLLATSWRGLWPQPLHSVPRVGEVFSKNLSAISANWPVIYAGDVLTPK